MDQCHKGKASVICCATHSAGRVHYFSWILRRYSMIDKIRFAITSSESHPRSTCELVNIRLRPSWLDLSVWWNRRGNGRDCMSASPNRHFASAVSLTQGPSVDNLIDSAHWEHAQVSLCKRSQIRGDSMKPVVNRSGSLRIFAMASRTTRQIQSSAQVKIIGSRRSNEPERRNGTQQLRCALFSVRHEHKDFLPLTARARSWSIRKFRHGYGFQVPQGRAGDRAPRP